MHASLVVPAPSLPHWAVSVNREIATPPPPHPTLMQQRFARPRCNPIYSPRVYYTYSAAAVPTYSRATSPPLLFLSAVPNHTQQQSGCCAYPQRPRRPRARPHCSPINSQAVIYTPSCSSLHLFSRHFHGTSIEKNLPALRWTRWE